MMDNIFNKMEESIQDIWVYYGLISERDKFNNRISEMELALYELARDIMLEYSEETSYE